MCRPMIEDFSQKDTLDSYQLNKKHTHISTSKHVDASHSPDGCQCTSGSKCEMHLLAVNQCCRDVGSFGVPLCDSVGRTERSALRALREQLFAHKSTLVSAFQEYDPDNTGIASHSRLSQMCSSSRD